MDPVRTAVRRALAACLGGALLVGPLLVGPLLGAPAQAARSAAMPGVPAQCGRVTAAEATNSAQAVFTGTVTGVRRDSGAKGSLFVNEVEVERVYKGALTQATVPVVTRPDQRKRVGLGALEEGERYLFFARVLKSSGDEPAYVAGGCSGTTVASDSVVGRIEELRGEGEAPVPPTSPPVEFSEVDDADPTSFTRAAAPGLALVLVGLLGLLVVGRLGRRAG